MSYRFTILKRVRASEANVIANYLDLEHLSYHSNLGACEVLSETDRTACFLLRSSLGPLRFRNVHYYELRPPNQIVNVVASPLGPMHVVSTAREIPGPGAEVCTEVEVVTEIHCPRWLMPVMPLVERYLRRVNRRVLEEDRPILERRQRLFGSGIQDYLRPEQVLLFKEALRRSYAPATGAPPPRVD